MTLDQFRILAILAATVILFVWGRWRHDMVALAALLACVAAGLVPARDAFAGFGHPAVITVACVLVLSAGLQSTGAIDVVVRKALSIDASTPVTIAALTGLGALMSSFMNNVGAMALLMPVAIQIAGKHSLPPGKILMPLSFGTILGGMTTLIGTPPNLIVSGFRAEIGTGSFGMFDFTPVGLAVAAGGVVFAAAFGWKLVPAREHKGEGSFDTGTYLTEVQIREGDKAAGQSLREIEGILDSADAQVVSLVRNDLRIVAPNPRHFLRPGDILVIEADPASLAAALSSLGLKMEDITPSGQPREKKAKPQTSDEVVLQELVVMQNSGLIGRSAGEVHIRTRFGLNLLAISRQGRRSIRRLRSTSIQAGDVLLMQGPQEILTDFSAEYGCVPLAERAIRVPDKRKAIAAAAIMLLAIGGAVFGLFPAAICLAAGVLIYMALRVIPLRRIYEAIDWPVIVLLGSMIPVAEAMSSTGAADLLAQSTLRVIAGGGPALALALILIVTMTLSDFMNNAATAAVMCPVAISTAETLAVSADSFLMAVAIGASCAFLTPIGHQNNTLILGPGGFRFGDYWKLGLPMEALVVAIAIPMLLWVWPL